MRLLLLMTAGLVAVGAGYQSATLTSTPDAELSAAATAARRSVARYRIVMPGSEAACSLVKGDRLSPQLTAITLSADCARLYPKLAEVRYWRDGGDGDVSFTGLDGRPMIEFTAGDGVAYETYEPAAPLLSLVVAD